MARSLLGVFGISALLLMSCTKSPQQHGAPNACALLTESAAEEALGVDLQQAQSQEFGENPRQTVVSNCLFVTKDIESVKTLSLTIRIGGTTDSAVNPATTLISTMKQDFGQRYEPRKVEGLGDGAVWDDSLKQLTVFKGSSTFALAAPGASLPDIENKLTQLAKSILG